MFDKIKQNKKNKRFDACFYLVNTRAINVESFVRTKKLMKDHRKLNYLFDQYGSVSIEVSVFTLACMYTI